MLVLAIDPGPTKTAAVLLESVDMSIMDVLYMGNEDLLETDLFLRLQPNSVMAIEMVACYGMAVGKDVFETVFWIGRYWEFCPPIKKVKVYRKDVKMHLCNSAKATDSNIRQALIDVYGGDEKAVGGKKCPECKGKGWRGAGRPICVKCEGKGWETEPGPLKGISGDQWAALGVGVTYIRTRLHCNES